MSQDCFADEIAIDFPSVEPAVERMRDAFLGERADDDVLRREVLVSRARGVRRTGRAARGADARRVPALRRARRNLDRAVRRLSAPARRCCVIRARHAAAGGRRRRAPPFPRVLARRRLGARRSPHRDRRAITTVSMHAVGGRCASRTRRTDIATARDACSTSTCVGILFIVWGLLTTLVGAVDARARHRRDRAHRVGRAGRQGGTLPPASRPPRSSTLALIAIVWGLAHVVVGLPLRRRRHWSRVAALRPGVRGSAAAAVRHGARLLHAVGAARARSAGQGESAYASITPDILCRMPVDQASRARGAEGRPGPRSGPRHRQPRLHQGPDGRRRPRRVHHRADDAGLSREGSDARSGARRRDADARA